jgi:hypothetical protein
MAAILVYLESWLCCRFCICQHTSCDSLTRLQPVLVE